MSGLFGENVNRSAKKSAEWYTPAWVFDELGIEFDTDPASPHDFDTHVPAKKKYTVFDDGLKREWKGLVWLNPPYSREVVRWSRRMIDHNNGLMLVFSRTDAAWFQEAMRAAKAVLFMAGRIQFVPGHENAHKNSGPGAGSAIFAFGDVAAGALRKLSDQGVMIEAGK
jgi:phage N-6-adenine-methyltransferase